MVRKTGGWRLPNAKTAVACVVSLLRISIEKNGINVNNVQKKLGKKNPIKIAKSRKKVTLYRK
jgi:cobalamin biosynthesis protein CobD/CbiB